MSLTQVVQRIRSAQKTRPGPPDKPVGAWLGKDLLDKKPVVSLTLILRTSACRWANCTMCGYPYDCAETPPSQREILAQVSSALGHGKGEEIVKIFTSGSFLDEREISKETRREILTMLREDVRIKKVIAETRPEHVSQDIIAETIELLGKKFEIAVGLETTNDTIRRDSINKGFTFEDFKRAAIAARAQGATVKAYLLLKPPFISEGTAILDAVNSIKEAGPYVDSISLNLCNVQKGTLVEELWKRGDYRPPWLWSAVKILGETKNIDPELTIISDPVGAGSSRGPHNCGACDRDVAAAIKDFSLTQDPGIFEGLKCDCIALWEKIVELEDLTFGAPIF